MNIQTIQCRIVWDGMQHIVIDTYISILVKQNSSWYLLNRHGIVKQNY